MKWAAHRFLSTFLITILKLAYGRAGITGEASVLDRVFAQGYPKHA